VSDPPVCRTCGAAYAEHIGSLPDGHDFAGRRLKTPLPGGDLWRCRQCGFVFRCPLLSDEAYETFYRGGALGVWDGDQPREDFRLIRETIDANENRPIDVLDVGCYTGQFLASMPKSVGMYGIEANKEAAGVAGSKGVKIVAETVEEFARLDAQFDVITACDVIEHVSNPLEFLQQLRGHLKSKGRLIITTGNCDAWLWRFSGARFWYCYFPEHISFIGTRWIRTIPQRVNLKLVRCIAFNYEGGSLKPTRVMATAIYRFSPAIYRTVRAALGKSSDHQAPPGNGATKDHILCVFEVA
jgi:SAM-dependent methyltransferase